MLSQTLVLRNSQRLGYAANLNRILAASTARYVLLLNTDMFFEPREQCLARMTAFMDARPDCGLAGCRLYHADGQEAFAARRFQTLPVLLARRFGLGRWMPGTLARYLYRDRDRGDSFQCDWLSGCFLMLRRAAYRQVGPLDERFGKYFEDVDLCLRMALAGWQVMYHGGTSCYHIEQRGSRRLLSRDGLRHARAYLLWLRKWGPLAARGLSQLLSAENGTVPLEGGRRKAEGGRRKAEGGRRKAEGGRPEAQGPSPKPPPRLRAPA